MLNPWCSNDCDLYVRVHKRLQAVGESSFRKGASFRANYRKFRKKSLSGNSFIDVV